MSDNTNNNPNAGKENLETSKNILGTNRDLKILAREYADLIREQNQELGTQKSIQTEITSKLQFLKSQSGELHKVSIGASISLSKSITKTLEDSISAGKNINQLESAKNKIKTQGGLIDMQIGALAKDSNTTAEELIAKAEKHKNLQKELVKAQLKYTDQLEKTNSIEADIEENAQQLLSSNEKIYNLGLELIGLSGEERKSKEEELKLENDKIKILTDSESLEKNLLKEAKEKLEISGEVLTNSEDKFKTLEKQLTVEERQTVLLEQSRETLTQAEKTLEGQLKLQKSINSALGLSGQGIAAFNKLLGGALGSTSEIEKESRKIVEAKIEERTLINESNGLLDEQGNVIQGNVSKMEGFGIQLNLIGKSIGKNMLDPLVLIGAALEFSDQTTSLQKSLAISRGEANDMVYDFQLMATNMGDMAITGTKIQAAFSSLSSQIGISGKAIKDASGEAAVLSEKLGISAEGVANTWKSSMVMGKSMKSIKLDIIASTEKIRTQTGISLLHNDILKTTLGITGQIRSQFKGNLPEMARAVALAKTLGLELEQVAKVGNSLLNFEESISSELEAELMTGKQLNLEKARLYALTGDYKNLTKEIAKQAGTFTDFNKMNVLQQNMLAKAFGMTSDEMANMLMDQEAMGKSAEQLRAEGKEELADRMEARTLQQQFNDAVLQLKEIFVKIAGGPIMEMLEGLAGAAETIFKMLAPLIKAAVILAKMVTSVINFVDKLGLLKPIIVVLAGMWALGKMTMWFNMAKLGFSNLKNTIKGTLGGIKSLVGGIKNFGKGANNIKFDPKMAGGGRFKDIKTGKMVSNKVAAAAGAKKPGDLIPKDISKDATAATKGGAATGKSSKGMASGLKELANGLKAMGAGKVLKGILNLALAGPAFIVALPSIPFLLFMGKVSLKNLLSNFTSLGMGLKSMSKTFLGSAALAAFGLAAILAIPSLIFLGGIALLGAVGAAGLTALSVGLTTLGAAASTGLPFIAVGLIAALGVSLIPFGIALAFAGAAMWMFGLGVQAALEPIPPVINALADAFVRVLGAFGDFITKISELPIGKLLAMGPALVLLGVGMGALGAGLLIAAPGLLLLSLFGLPALNGLAKLAPVLNTAILTMASAFERIAKAAGNFFTDISKLPVGKLLAMGPALVLLGVGMGALGAGLLIAAPGLLLLSLFGLPALRGLAELAPALNSVILTMAEAFEKMAKASGNFFKDISKLDPGQLAMLGPAFISMGVGLAALGVGALFAAPGLWLLGKRMHIFKKLAKIAPQMKDMADAIDSLSGNMGNIRQLGIALKELAEAVSDFNSKAGLSLWIFPAFAGAMYVLAPALILVGMASKIFGEGLKAALAPIPPILDAIATATERVMKSFGDFFVTLGTLNPLQLIALGPGFISMGIGLTALGIGALIAAPGLWLLEQRMPLFKTLGDLAPSLKASASAVDALSKNVGNMKAIGKGFKEMGSGLRSLAFGLMMIAPFLPVLESVSKMTHTLGSENDNKKEKGEMGQKGNQTVKLDDSTMKQMASLVAQAVSNVQINGDVNSDLWGQGNRNGNGEYASKVKSTTKFS